jgi:hypothetical protein
MLPGVLADIVIKLSIFLLRPELTAKGNVQAFMASRAEEKRLLAGAPSRIRNFSVHMDTGRQRVWSRKMETLRTRLRRLEKEAGFRRWLDFSRLLENLSDSQLEEVAIYFRFPDPMPEPLSIGMSKLDGLDRKTLLRMWEESERTTARTMHDMKGRNEVERQVHVHHGHWPEQTR